jgi:hypothetical protein
MVDAFDEHEFTARRRILKDEIVRMNEELAKLCILIMTPEQLEQRKDTILTMSRQIQMHNIPVDPPFELKQQIIKLIVDEIILDVSDDLVTVKGAIHRVMSIENTHALAAIMAIL